MTKEAADRPVARLRAGAWSSVADSVVVEEPLEIRIGGDPVAVTMRTPGRDHELVLGFLLAEGIIRALADVGTIAHCGRPGEEGFGNVIDVAPGPGIALDLERHAVRRGGLTSSACGVCGRATIDDLLERIVPLDDRGPVERALISRSVELLAEHQTTFRRTGGLHGAAALSREGKVLAAAEDVGRHNATDKVCGALLRASERADVLVVSGRVGFEIVQKAAASRIGCVVGVSAASTLAVDLAGRAGMVLAGFVRHGDMNVYSGKDRVTS